MDCYFKCVAELADWLDNSEHPMTRTYVRHNQEDRAIKALEESARSGGGFLLTYIMGVRCWAGMDRIIGTQLRKSDIGGSWREECPYYFDLKPIYTLHTPERCFLVRESKIRSGHDGRGIYTRMRDPSVCEAIRKQIAKVAAMSDRKAKAEATSDPAFKDFELKWNNARDRSRTFTRWQVKRSGGRCKICGVTKQEWINRILKKASAWRRAFDMNRIRGNDFELLQVHHREPVKDGGTATLDNLMAICPNCHALLTRAGRHANA